MLLKQELSVPRRRCRKMLIPRKSPAAASCAFGCRCRAWAAAADRVSTERADGAAAACPERGPRTTSLPRAAGTCLHQHNPSPLPTFPAVMLGPLRTAWAQAISRVRMLLMDSFVLCSGMSETGGQCWYPDPGSTEM